MERVRNRLIEIIRQKSFASGRQFRLASGRVSNIYFNLKPTMMHPEGSWLISELILDAIDGMGADYIGGLAMGAVPLAASAATLSFERKKPLRAFFIRKEAKQHGTRQTIEGLMDNESLKGSKVVIVEDVTTTGGSALQAIEIAQAEGAEILCAITVVDRQEGAEEAFHAAGVPFTPLLTAADFL